MKLNIPQLAARSGMLQARSELARSDEQTLALQASLSAIPAPTGAESARARAVLQAMTEIGLETIDTDGVGNVTGWRHGTEPATPPVLVAAHLDTVFGPDVDVSVRRTGNLLTGPGIADNARGLAG